MKPSWPAARRWLGEHGVLVAAVLIVATVAWYFGDRLGLLRDEAYTYATVRRPLPETVQESLTFELQPPLYFVLLNLWLRISPAIPWARLLSAIAVVLIVVVSDRLARSWGGAARLLPLFMALSPGLLWATSSARCYALAALGIASSLFLFRKSWLLGVPPRAGTVAAFVAAAYGSVLTFYYCGFVIAAMFLAGLLVRPRARSFWIAFGALALLMVPWLAVIRHQIAVHPLYDQALVDSRGVLATLTWAAGTAVDGLLGTAPLLQRPGVRAGVAMVALGVLLCRLWSLRKQSWTSEETALVVIAMGPAITLVVLRYSNTVYVDGRHWTPVAVVMVACAVRLASRCEPLGLRRTVLGAMLALTVASAASQLRNRRNLPDFPAAVAWMRAADEDSGLTIFVARGANALTLRHYVSADRVVAIPREAPLRHPGDDQIIREVAEVRGHVDARVAAGARYWFVREPDLARFGEAVLDSFLRREATILQDRDTGGLRIQLLLRRPVE